MAHPLRKTVFLIILIFLLSVPAWAAIDERHEIVSSGNAWLRALILALGGLTILGGIVLAAKNSGVIGNLDISVKNRQASLKRVSQGVFVVAIGAGILISGLYLLPDKKEVSQKHTVIYGPNGMQTAK